jgi:hypothetical protein
MRVDEHERLNSDLGEKTVFIGRAQLLNTGGI